jgi:MoaA/NifB/PqqE/SkfB family radical SAM enzyme
MGEKKGTRMQGLDRLFRKAMELRHPLTVHFDLTYRCPQRCLHCYLPEAWRRGEEPGPELDTAQVKGILDQLAAAGTFFLTFSGGEICLRPDILDLLEHACPLNFCISLMTSGNFKWDRSYLRALVGLRVDRVRVSLYSLEAAIHDRITGAAGSWVRVRRFIDEARALGLKLGLNSVALKLNYRGLADLKEFASREKIPYLVDDHLVPRWDGRPHPPGLALGPAEKQALVQDLSVEENRRPQETVTTPLEAEWYGCGAGSRSGYLTPRGEVWPCIDVPWPCGRLNGKEQFQTVWQNSPALQRVRDLHDRAVARDERLCDYWKKEKLLAPVPASAKEGEMGDGEAARAG